jgi:murein DD-endopeptidase MepM/ murein hydrolase activator NlpD
VASAISPPPLPPVKPGRGFIWPVKGAVIAEYGSTGKGQHNDGINIAVPKGTPVVAADDGVVAYAGNELRGFGNLLLLKHADGWMTAYAHNDALLVKRGDTVRRGQQIARSGDSGGVSQPQLHFELRQGTHAIDPMTQLRGDRPSPASSQADQQDPG